MIRYCINYLATNGSTLPYFSLSPDRYKHLPQPEHKLRFLALQQELLEDFRTRLVQVMKQEAQNVLGQQYCSILNTASYIVEVLQQWSELVVSISFVFHKYDLILGSLANILN